MDPGSEGAAVEPESVRTKLGRWARRRGRQSLILAAALAALAVVIVAGACLERSVGMLGLPDIGDPFDVAAFKAERPPEDRDAFVAYRQAWRLLEKVPSSSDLSRPMRESIPWVAWSAADPKVRAWAEARRAALDQFLVGTELADGWAHPLEGESSLNCPWYFCEPFVHLALLEASRIEEAGDMTGAWRLYRAILSMHSHIARRGTGIERTVANDACKSLSLRIRAWAADPRTSTEDVKRALMAIEELAPRPEWEISSLKAEYLLAMNELDRDDAVLANAFDIGRPETFFGSPLPPNLLYLLNSVRRFRLHEPERTRRALRLVFSDWLAHFGLPVEARGKPVLRVRLWANSPDPRLHLYADGPPASRPIALRALAEWILSAPDFLILQGRWDWAALGETEHRQHGEVLVDLAIELYRREHGKPPAREADLVGSYLDRLPSGASELDNLPEALEEVYPRTTPDP